MTGNPNLDLRGLTGAQGKAGRDRPIATGLASARPAANLITPDSFYYATDTGVLSYSNGTAWTTVSGAGRELAYTAFTANVSITGTTSATATTIVTAPALTFDGSTTVEIECYAYAWQPGMTNVVNDLYMDGASIGVIGWNEGGILTMHNKGRVTPAAGSHTFSSRAYVDAGTGTIYGAVGGAANGAPGFIRVTRV